MKNRMNWVSWVSVVALSVAMSGCLGSDDQIDGSAGASGSSSVSGGSGNTATGGQSSATGGSGNTATGGTSNATTCNAGDVHGCPCGAGSTGKQVCNADGKGYGSCDCSATGTGGSGNVSGCAPGLEEGCMVDGSKPGVKTCQPDKTFGTCVLIQQCVAGRTIGCEVDGKPGSQTCLQDGSGYCPCEAFPGTGGTTGAGGSPPATGGTQTTGGTPPATGGTPPSTKKVAYASYTTQDHNALSGLVFRAKTGNPQIKPLGEMIDRCNKAQSGSMSVTDNGDSFTFTCTFEVDVTDTITEVSVQDDYGDLSVTLPSHTKTIWQCYELLGQDAVNASCKTRSDCWRLWGRLQINGANGTMVENGLTSGCNERFSL